MKLGLDLTYSGARISLPIEKVQLAEKLGFDSVWCAEAYGTDALTPLAYIAALTKKLRLGTGIAQLAARTPAWPCKSTAKAAISCIIEPATSLPMEFSGPGVSPRDKDEMARREVYFSPLVLAAQVASLERTIRSSIANPSGVSRRQQSSKSS